MSDWYDLAESSNDGLADLWDSLAPLPEPGQNDALDAFLARKHLDHRAMVRLGTRMRGPLELAYAYPGGVKFRHLETGARSSALGSTFDRLKVIRTAAARPDTVLIAEGETDAARLTMLYQGQADVAVLPAGAKTVKPSYLKDLEPYARVIHAGDADAAGQEGFQKWRGLLPHLARLVPPEGAVDWCDVNGVDPPPLPAPAVVKDFVTVSELNEIEHDERESYFEHALVPVSGLVVVHGWAKSFKSAILLDIAVALATARPWATFEYTGGEPARVGVLQWEIPHAYWKQRLARAVELAGDAGRQVDENLLTFRPPARPRLYLTGNEKTDRPQIDDVVRAATAADLDVIMFDPLRRMLGAGVDATAEAGMRVGLQLFQRCQDEGLTVLFAHHDNKGSAKAGDASLWSMTGSGAVAGDVDSAIGSIAVKGDPPDSSSRKNLHFALRHDEAPRPIGYTFPGQYSTDSHAAGGGHDDTSPDL